MINKRLIEFDIKSSEVVIDIYNLDDFILQDCKHLLLNIDVIDIPKSISSCKLQLHLNDGILIMYGSILSVSEFILSVGLNERIPKALWDLIADDKLYILFNDEISKRSSVEISLLSGSRCFIKIFDYEGNYVSVVLDDTCGYISIYSSIKNACYYLRNESSEMAYAYLSAPKIGTVDMMKRYIVFRSEIIDCIKSILKDGIDVALETRSFEEFAG